MRKIFYTIFLIFILFSSSYASSEIKIISRAEWGADENIRFRDSVEWQAIFKKWEIQAEKNKDITYTPEQIAKNQASKDRAKLIDEILIRDFPDDFKTTDKVTTENGRKLFWPIQKAEKIKGIVIHHTAKDYESSEKGVRDIYKYHTLTNGWGDVGYNYLIGNDGEIYEGRAGGDNAVAAHNKYNNIGNIGIAIIGDFSEKPINDKQYNSLKNLTSYLVNKYNIDLNKKVYFHEECIGANCEQPIISQKLDPIIGHRDAGHTSCPGEELYNQIIDMRNELIKNTSTLKKVSNTKLLKAFEKLSDEKLIDILAKIEVYLDNHIDTKKSTLRSLIIDYFKQKKSNKYVVSDTKDNTINIKLSYPNNESIKIKSGTAIFELTREGNSIIVKGKSFNILKIPKSNTNNILEILSWDRKPDWDKTGEYNDNKFRGDLVVYAKDEKLIVVNRLKIEDYLKGLGEVSDDENTEKIKTIIIAARTYATWYVTKARKFPGELYDGSDDPNEFQRYLGYGLETRSPKVNKAISETKGQVITYRGELIKPWYFSNSDGKTLSYYEYCLQKYSDVICKIEAKKYPYLQSVTDKASNGKAILGHGVGISGLGAKYFSIKGWTYEMIIKYYLRGVDIL
ncbi:MAG: N-acetylmuramoyl-L-alanine amidase [Candidatus Gracilibacteria bacterium]|nr:N-acetylmuramoyl-L-alanine amidase [Candidatus Gracilibacteria bacterium]